MLVLVALDLSRVIFPGKFVVGLGGLGGGSCRLGSFPAHTGSSERFGTSRLLRLLAGGVARGGAGARSRSVLF